MDAIVELKMGRMGGTPLRREHFAEIRRLHTDPRVTATLSFDGKPFSATDTRVFLNRCDEHWRRHGFGLWLLRLLTLSETSNCAGSAGVEEKTVESRVEGE